MNSFFKNSIINHSKEFTSSEFYRTVTRKNGSEIITVTGGKITLTQLNTDKSPQIAIAEGLPFEPIEILMNECEQLLCAYDQTNCWLFSLNKEGTSIRFTVTYKVKLDLAENETVLQVVFNNISKYQSEIVVLTTTEIRAYNTNLSLKSPVIRYNFKKEYEKNISSNTYDISDPIIDPVSICFASCPPNSVFEFEDAGYFSGNTPQNDLTLFLLTSDASVYQIFPFFPYELSASKEWLGDLFDSTSILFKSKSDSIEQFEMMASVKVSALLSKASNPASIEISDALPSIYRKGKITGPLSMESFPEDLYVSEAIKLLSLPNDLLIIVFNHTVVVFNRNSKATMIFEDQKIETRDSFLLLDSIIFNKNEGDVFTAMVHPVTRDSVFVVSSNGSLIQVDFSKWIEPLTAGLNTGDLSEFNKLCQTGNLPTEVITLGKMHLSKEKPLTSRLTLRTHENSIWFSWNTRDVYAMVIKANTLDILSMFLVSTSKASTTEAADFAETQNEKISGNEKDKKSYKSLLLGNYEKDVMPLIKGSLAKITEINSAMQKFPSTILNEQNTTASELKTVHELSELATSGQLILFRILSIITDRLRLMTNEYHNQINTYHQIMLQKEAVVGKFLRLKGVYLDSIERQKKLNARMVNVMSSVEKLESTKNMTNVSISYQENAYFKELARIRDFTVKKESELEEVEFLLTNIKNAEKSVLTENKEVILKNFESRRILEKLKLQLETQDKFVEYLVSLLRNFNID
ncbi:hypothetical protein PICMEDRAFT_74569 [Pichia membranifaciens NRRL Y-2026]|uniref:Nucleoporin Nup82 n=1 Tax=Pichia membranifaciens NRRL Y-2026 TaxID=763406 RepID=A0A1E3NFG0_9ASCO|nr:hypothetical protein PICMEDRAFT_74569 [Pichia membranifaciens NRRL Y-2026]ODQ44318.1 hypothetical protein PICMEDRAFT_74569 [Pichia membranifaciens NRRL Y-2026]